MSARTPTAHVHWERYADELLGRAEEAERRLLDARAEVIQLQDRLDREVARNEANCKSAEAAEQRIEELERRLRLAEMIDDHDIKAAAEGGEDE